MTTPGGWGLFAGWLLKSSAQAALLVVLVLAVQWLLRRWLTPRWRYFLWWLVVARLLMPVSLPGPLSIFNWVKWNSPPAPAMAVTPITPDVALPASPPETVATTFEETTPELSPQSPVTIATPAPTAPTRPHLDWRLAVMWLWLAGAALLGARLVWSVLRLRRELRTATPVDDPTVLALLDDCRERMRVRDRLTLLETPLVDSPALCGFWRPKLLLPPRLCRDFTAPQLRFIFLHELAHVRRHDIAVNWLITLLQLLHWFNAFVWLAFSRLRADRELACDALALSAAAPGEQHAYGQTIIRLLEGFARPSAMPGLVGILEDKNQMKRRIRMIAQFRRPGRWAWLSGIAATILGIACLTDAQVPGEKNQAKNRSGISEREVVSGSPSVTSQIKVVREAAQPIRAKPEYSANVNEPPMPVSNSLPTMSITSDGSIDLNMATGQIEARSNVVIEMDQQTMKCSSFSITRRDGKFVFKCTGGRLEMVRTRSPLTNRVPRLAGDVPERGFREDETVSGLSDTSGQALPEVISGTVFETKAGKRTLGFAWESNIDRAANVSTATIRDFRIRLGGSLIWGDTATLLHEGDQLIIRANQLFIEEKRRVSREKPAARSKQLLIPGAATNAEHAKVDSVSLQSVKTDSPGSSGDDTSNSDGNAMSAKSATNSLIPRASANAADGTTNRNGGSESANRRGEMYKRLERIRLPRVSFDGVPLPQVIKELARLARENDPEQRGVNFLLSAAKFSDKTPPTNAQTGLPEPVAEPSVENVVISLAVLKDVTLEQVLDAVVKCASHPIRFQVEERFVVISAVPTTEVPVLFTRWFKVDPNTFARALGELIGDGLSNSPPTVARTPSLRSTNAPAITLERLRRFLSSTGIDLVPPKSVFFNDRLGMLMVRATQRELDTVEQAIQVLNQSPPQVSIEVKFAEVSSDDADGKAFLSLIGFDAAATNAVPTTPRATLPGSFMSGVENTSASDRSGRGGVLNTGTNLPPPAFTSILKADQFRAILQALEKRKGVDLLSMPKVTTLSGRQAQIKTVEIKYVVTAIDNSPAPDRKPQPIAEPFELGPILDVIPDVSADGRTIRMTMIPTIKEFLGYDTDAAKQFQTATENSTIVPLPKFRLRQVMATANVADGQTVVLSLGSVEVEAKSGDGKGKTTRKHLFIFVTPTLMDPAGNPVHGQSSRP